MGQIVPMLLSLLLLVLGSGNVWGEDYSGTYYIKSNNNTEFYLCTSTVFYDGNHYANSGEMPYLTTAKEAKIADCENEAVWRIIKAESGNYYYVVHAVDGKYLTYNDDPTNFNDKNGNRLSLHLQYLKDEDKSLFIITKNNSGWYNISPKNKSTWSLNPAGDNYDDRAGTSNKTQNIPGAGNGKNVGGLIGLWLNTDAKSKWQFEAVTGKPICEAPTFTNNGSLSISCNTTNAEIYYTTDGSTVPTKESSSGNPVAVTEDIDVVWARATTQDNEPYYWSPLSVYVIPQCATPVISIINGKLNLSCATEGVTIYYTINGTEPTTEYDPNNKPDVTENDIIKAVATKNGYHKSNVASILPSQTVHNTSEMNNMYAHYILASDFVVSSSVGTEAEPFCGVIDGGLNTFSGFDKALVAYANGATIKNVILDNVTIGENANGYAGAICSEALGDTRIYNCGVKSGTISGTNAGSIVGKLDGNARVINCYSFATVSGGTWGAGIVGYNSFSSTRSDLRTMVMNCMFYGEISSNSKLSPIYGGEKITNVSNLNGYNYYRFNANYSKNNDITDYNCALAAEEDYLTRFEFFRNTLNSNRELAAWYATDNPNDGKGIGNACKMAKWVLDPADKPYPILKAQDYYPSFINYEDAPNLGTIDLTINESNTTTGGEDKPNGASINSNYPTTLTVYDKDLTHKHFNYRTVRLPYYNEVGTGNCTHNKVVTGWKITGFSGGTQGHFVKNVIDYSGTTHDEDEYPPYNFADRYCTDKDKYAVSGRVFSQGAYYDVPEGVTGITIEPYWGAAVYLSDPTYDVAYPEGYGDKNVNAVFVSNMGSRYVGGNTASINDDNQTVYTDYDSAFGQVGSSGTVYDNAIVLVGNYHHYWGQNSPSTTKAFTIMSADLNNDCEPDYSFIVQHGTNRQDISAIRFDFINSPGLGMIQKVETDKAIPKHGIWYPKGWFEVTNTTLIQFTQFEYDKGGKPAGSPLILLGGIYDQFVTSRYDNANSTEYIHLGSNVWMKEFCNGTHTSSAQRWTRHVPISVTGGEFESFYLTGTFQPNANSVTDNAECYINGGKFGDMAGAGQEQLKGDVTWLIDHADITNFYGGGINDQKPITGHIYVEINNSQVGLYCGGPKFGNMQKDKKVTTKAKGSTFGNFYGAGYGGTSYFRHKTQDITGGNDWDTWNADYTRKYVAGKGISTGYEYEFIPYSGGESGQADYVGRFYVLYASLSLAETKNVESTLEDCHITGSFYGGGKLGSVDGNITSTLKNCTVGANVYGAGFSASVETVNVVDKGAKMNPNPAYNESVGVFTDGVYPDGEEYTWTHAASVSAGNEFDKTNKYIFTTADLTTLGTVTGDATLNIEGTTSVTGSVFGGGDESAVSGNTIVKIKGDATVAGSVYGGGNMGSIGTFTYADEAYHTSHSDVPVGQPIGCADNTGTCTVVIQGNAEIGPNGMKMTKAGGPDDAGHVFGAGKGTVDLYYDDNTMTAAEKQEAIAALSDNEKQEKLDNLAKIAFVNSTDITIKENAFVKGSVYGGSESGHMLGSTYVKIQGGQIGNGDGKDCRYTVQEWTAGNPTSFVGCSHWTYENNGHPYDKYARTEEGHEEEYDNGNTTEGGRRIATDGHTFYGNVFGGGSGYYPYAPGQWIRSAGWVKGNTRVEITGGHILNNVYGGCEMADVDGSATVEMSDGTVGVPRTKEGIVSNPSFCHIYGAGMGDKRIFFNTSTNVASTSVSVTGGKVYGSVYGGGEDGHVLGNASTTISQATEKTTIIGCDGTSGYDGNVFGGGQGSSTALTAGVVGGNVSLNIQGGSMKGSVYGGGRIASVGTFFAMADDPNYGKMQVGDDHGCLSVNLTGGTIEQNVYGGCMGTTENLALGVSKNVAVNLNKDVDDAAQGCAVKGNIFGCNNVNSSPEGTVLVHIYKTQRAGKSRITNGDNVTDAKVPGSKNEEGEFILNTFDVQAVYGGGNLAAYTPLDATSTEEAKKKAAHTTVIIDGCGKTSIGQIYGGGNAASTPATEVTINGTYEIGEVFGGGNGKDAIGKDSHGDDIPNPGANVGFYDYHEVEDNENYDTKEERETNERFIAKYVYGSGQAAVNIYGGTIHRVFGGSNTKGNVRKTAVTMLEDKSECEFCVDEAYGGGKSAPMDAEAKLLMSCIPGLNVAYGGAEAADIQGNVILNITNGKFDRVFGGNNKSGTIRGSITVNIEETGCKPIIIGELYGGGNLAGYSIYGYKEVIEDNKKVWKPRESESDEGTGPIHNYADPQINVKSFTSIGDIYGGGLGESALMVGSPTVNINVANGKFYNNDDAVVAEGTKTPGNYPIPSHAKGKIGAINNVFGGGNAAKVIGNTNVDIGTQSEVYVIKSVAVGDPVTDYFIRNFDGTYSAATGTAVEGTTYYEKKDVIGADIRGNVYGGGNNAEVTGNTNVQIGKKATE